MGEGQDGGERICDPLSPPLSHNGEREILTGLPGIKIKSCCGGLLGGPEYVRKTMDNMVTVI